MPSITIPRRECTILAGASGAGKTTLIFEALSEWSQGRVFTDALRFEGASVAYLVADRSMQGVQAKIVSHGLLGAPIEVYGIQDDLSLDLGLLRVDPFLTLADILKNKFKKPFELLVIDPIGLFINGKTNDYISVAVSLLLMGRIAIERNITILATHHVVKSRSDFHFERPQDRISGSGAFQGYSGTQMCLIQGKETGRPYDELYVIPHDAPESMVALSRNPGNGRFILYDDGDGPGVVPPDEASKGIDLLWKGLIEMPIGEIFHIGIIHKMADKYHIERKTMYDYLRSFLDEGKIAKVKQGQYVRKED